MSCEDTPWRVSTKSCLFYLEKLIRDNFISAPHGFIIFTNVAELLNLCFQLAMLSVRLIGHSLQTDKSKPYQADKSITVTNN